jgi:hypothetical protein
VLKSHSEIVVGKPSRVVSATASGALQEPIRCVLVSGERHKLIKNFFEIHKIFFRNSKKSGAGAKRNNKGVGGRST